MGFEKAHHLMLRLEPLSAEQRVDLLVKSAPSRLLPVLFKYRYLAIILVLNMPGNAVLGGGGGIALLAGLSGLFSLPGYSAAVALGVLPVPLAVAILGQRQ